MFLTYGQVKQTCADALKWCTTDGRLLPMVNRAQEELKNAVPDFVGKHVRMRLCAYKGMITWPEEIETIEKVSVDKIVIPVKDFWFEMLENATSIQEPDNCPTYGRLSLDRWDAPGFDDIRGSGKKLKIYCDQIETNVTIRFGGNNSLTEGKTRVRSINAGVWVDGEVLTLDAGNPPTTTNVFLSWDVAVFNTKRNSYTRVYEVDPITLEERLIAIYEPNNLNPTFRRSYIPGICREQGCEDEDDTACGRRRTVTIIGKRRLVPCYTDADYVLIPNQTALADMCKSLYMKDNYQMNESEAYRRTAIRSLQEQFQNWRGLDAIGPMRMQLSSSFGTGGVINRL